MKHKVIKRSIVIGKTKTSISLEDPFHFGLKEIAAARDTSVRVLLNELHADQEYAANFSSSIRLFVLDYYMKLARAGAVEARSEGERPATYEAGP